GFGNHVEPRDLARELEIAVARGNCLRDLDQLLLWRRRLEPVRRQIRLLAYARLNEEARSHVLGHQLGIAPPVLADLDEQRIFRARRVAEVSIVAHAAP